jgi:hypothetical protein
MSSLPNDSKEGISILQNDTANPELPQKADSRPPKHKFPRKNAPKWDIFWISMIILICSLQYYFLFTITIPLTHYIPIAVIALIVLMITFFWSSKSVADGYSIAKQAICYMGSIKGRRSGSSNKKALILFIAFGFFYGVLNFSLMHFYTIYYPDVVILTASRLFLFLSTLVILMMSIIPIDIHELKHLYTALLVFIITEVASGCSAAFFIMEGIDFPLLYVVIIIEFILAAGYMYSYLTHYRYAAVFQKSCIMFTGIAFFLYLTYFVNLPT